MKKLLNMLLAIACISGLVTGAFAIDSSFPVTKEADSVALPRSIALIPYDIIAEGMGTKEYNSVPVNTSNGQYLRVWFKSSTPSAVDILVFANGSSSPIFNSRWNANQDNSKVFMISSNVTSLRVVVQRNNTSLLSGEFALAQYYTDPT